jgi:hypothetical protein
MRISSHISTALLPPALMTASSLVALTAQTAAGTQEPSGRHVDGALQTIRTFSTSEHGVARPTGMAWSTRLQALVLEGAGKRRAVRPDETDLGRVAGSTAAARPAPSVDALAGHDLRGRGRHPRTGAVFTYDATTVRLLELRGGEVVGQYDATDLSVDDVRGVVIAPSTDPTDPASELSVYVVDNGAPGNFGEVVEATFVNDPPLTATLTPIAFRTVETSAFSPPSPDPSGVAYLPGTDRLLMADGEVDEMTIYEGANLFTTTLEGDLTDTGDSTAWSSEPVGVGYNPTNDHLFVSDDSAKTVTELSAGPDDLFGTGDDTVASFDVLGRGVGDPEGIDYDVATDSLWFAGGMFADLHRVQAMGDGRFGTGDDVWTHWDVGVYGAQDPEGLAFDQARGTVLLLDDSSETIYEMRRDATLVDTIDLSPGNMVAASGLAVGPASDGSDARTVYVAARGQDNNTNPDENDGRLYEVTLEEDGGSTPTPPPTPAPPPPTTGPAPAPPSAPPGPAAVDPRLTAQAADDLVRAGRRATITGELSPALAGQEVELQRRDGSSWVGVTAQTVPGGAAAPVRFTTTSASAAVEYRLFAPPSAHHRTAVSGTVTVLFHRLGVQRVRPQPDVVTVKNLGAVRIDLAGWVLRNQKNGRTATLPSFALAPGKTVRIHSGDGASTRRHLYLDTRQLWGTHGKAQLRDTSGSLADVLRY